MWATYWPKKGENVDHLLTLQYIYIYADESNNGTLFAHLRVKQRDAHALNNGTRPGSHYKNSGFALFIEVPISAAASSAWLIDDVET